jgi:hypothetical protein
MQAARTRALDDAFLAIVADWRNGGPGCSDAQFDERARALCAYQLEFNAPYARFAKSLGFDVATPPAEWREIPAVPSSAFKDAALATFPVAGAEALFHTSGTTEQTPGKHYLERAALYDAALAATFDRFMLPDGARLRYLNLVPNPRLRPHSSLGYMMGHVSVLRGVRSTKRRARRRPSASRELRSASSRCSTPSRRMAAASRRPRVRASWKRAASKDARERSSAANSTRGWKVLSRFRFNRS